MSTIEAPDEVIVSGHSVVVIWDDLGKEGLFGDSGEIDGQYYIRISNKLVGTVLADTFFHELLHIIMLINRIKRKNSEERTVTILATQIVAVLRHNPNTRAWLFGLID